MERPPSALYLECPECGEETKHKVHKGRFEGKKNKVMKVVVECSDCGNTREEELRQEKERTVTLMVSDGGQTEHSSVVLGEDEVLRVGEELYTEQGLRTVIASLESSGRRVNTAPVPEVETIWAKASEEVRVKVSINKGSSTVSKDVVMHYDEEISIGDMVDIDGKMAVIHKIKTTNATLNKGVARAEDVVRMYARLVRERWA